jgi:branched-chain amino acid aminotransferase
VSFSHTVLSGPRAAARPRLVHHAGRLVPGDQATVPAGSITTRYAISAFEGVRLYRQEGPPGTVRPWLLAQHLDRLRHSCRIMGLDAGCADRVPRVIEELVVANSITEDSYVRIAAGAGNPGGIGDPAQTVLTVSAAPSGPKRWLATGEGMRLLISDWQRPPERAFPSAAKNISAYAGPRLAQDAASAAGYDGCVLLTCDGLISEAPTASVFLVEGGRLVTPRLSDVVLPGVTSAWVLATARTVLGLDVRAEAVTPERLRRADEVFLCGTGTEFAPVREIDGNELRGWPYCAVTTDLVDAYFRQVRGESAPTAVPWNPTAEPGAVPSTTGGVPR